MCRLFLWYVRASVILFGYPHTKGYYDNRWQGKCSKLAPYTAFIYFSTAEGIPLAAIPGSAWTCYPSFDLLMASVTSQCPLFLSMRQLLTLKWLPEQQQEASKQWVQFIVVIRSSQLGLKRGLEKWVLQVHRVSQKTLHEPCWLFTIPGLEGQFEAWWYVGFVLLLISRTNHDSSIYDLWWLWLLATDLWIKDVAGPRPKDLL